MDITPLIHSHPPTSLLISRHPSSPSKRPTITLDRKHSPTRLVVGDHRPEYELFNYDEESNEKRPRPRSLSHSYPTSSRTTRSRWRNFLSIYALPRALPRKRYCVCLALGLLALLTVFTVSSLQISPDHIRIPPSPISAAAKAAAELSKPKPGDDGASDGEQAPPEPEPEISRSFEEPDFALLSSPQPHTIGCDIPLDWLGKGGAEPGPSANEDENGVLVLLGVFSAAAFKGRRDLYRKIYFPDFPKHLVTPKFIIGLPPYPPYPTHPSAVGRAKVMRQLEEENAEHGDMVILDMVDNIDDGKTFKYFQWVAKEYGGEGRVKGRPRFVMKSDDDTLLIMPNMIAAFRNLDCSKNVYWGTSAGRSDYFGDYFRGLAYAMSWPLISWIGNADMPLAHIVKIEDARTGQWLRNLDPMTDPIQRINMGWTMGDWNQLDYAPEITALHWVKWDDWVIEQHEKIKNVWRDAELPYEWDKGIDPAKSIEVGRRLPEGALREHEKQKEMGWDVGGNVLGPTE